MSHRIWSKQKGFTNLSTTSWLVVFFTIIMTIIIITSRGLIARWGQLRLLLEPTCIRFLSSFSFYRRRYLHPFPSNTLTDDAFSTLRMSLWDNWPVSDLSRVIPWIVVLSLNTVPCRYVSNNVTTEPWRLHFSQ